MHPYCGRGQLARLVGKGWETRLHRISKDRSSLLSVYWVPDNKPDDRARWSVLLKRKLSTPGD